MATWAGLYALIGIVAALSWYYWATRQNRSRAVQVLRWIESALNGRGHVLGIRWITGSQFEVPLRFASQLFRGPTLLVTIAPRELPLKWVFERMRGEVKETVTFYADLDLNPGFNMELQHLRWFARTRRDLDPNASSGWDFENSIPLVLTTKVEWQKEITSVIQSVLNCEQCELMNIIFRERSPQFSATIPLDAMRPGHQAPVVFFESLQTIASGASAKAS